MQGSCHLRSALGGSAKRIRAGRGPMLIRLAILCSDLNFKQPEPKPSLRAQRSNPSYRTKKEWIASLTLAMTTKHTFAISRRDSPEFCL